MSEVCFSCVKNNNAKLGSAGTFLARAIVTSSPVLKIGGVGTIVAKNSLKATAPVKLSSTSNINGKYGLKIGLRSLQESGVGNIKAALQVRGNAIGRVSSSSKFVNTKTDKFAGAFSRINSFEDFQSTQKLYPTKDLTISLNNSYFVDKFNNSTNLFASIDEGVFTGNYTKHGKNSKIISDEKLTYIHPSSVMTDGDFRYSCEVTPPVNAKESFLFIRAAAPTYTKSSDLPPQYKIHNIKLLDPSGNLIIKYKDIYVRGDADYASDYVNFVTYISEPETNNLLLKTWESGYPLMGHPSGYSLNLDFAVDCIYDPFSEGFDKGYEDTCKLDFVPSANNNYLAVDGSPLSTQVQNFSLNPENSIRISAIEICNSGGYDSYFSSGVGFARDNHLSFYTDVSPIGQRLTKHIVPIDMIASDVDVDIYPHGYSLWESNPDSFGVKANSLTQPSLVASKLQDEYPYNYIKLLSSTPHIDSGRLTLRFTNLPPKTIFASSDGAFTQSFFKGSYDISEVLPLESDDNFFIIDEVYLKVIAKKDVGSPDYSLDVVGYNDDKLLNRTPKIGAFLQNDLEITYISDELNNLLVSENDDYIVDVNQYGESPASSGFIYPVDDFALSSKALSNKEQFFLRDLTLNPAKDHYALSRSPVINSIGFKEYKIPLKIYDDPVLVGKSVDYRNSSYIENLFIDLYPIPSGASISTVQLVVKYKPSNGLMLHTFAQGSKELTRRRVTLYPKDRQQSDEMFVSADTSNTISNIPHAYKDTNKTNYSRRWRGVDGNVVSGPYNPNQFDFSFFNPEVAHPFLNGYYDFTNTSGNWVISNDYSSSGRYIGSNELLTNIGWRFNNDQLFSTNTAYKTINCPSNQLTVSDSFDSAIRLSTSGNINFGTFDLSNGFALFLRFSPDENHTFENGHSILSTYDNASNQLPLCVGINNKRLCVKVRDKDNNEIQISDTVPYSGYSYPLSILATHTGGISGVLSLYAHNELTNDTDLRASGIISELNQHFASAPIVVGYESHITLNGGNIFIHEFGISNNCNIVESNPNRYLKQTTVQNILRGHKELHSYIDDEISSWKIGDFKVCSFSADFDRLTKRDGKDFILHSLKHDGRPYSETTDLTLPSSIYASGLSYHTQIENDFLRIFLSDVDNNFYSTHPRICKTLPRGYNFAEDALVVDSVVEHETLNNIRWPDGSIGPKLIVSLYTPSQDPAQLPSKKNWGLVNRSIHYLEPSGCWQKLHSKFTYRDLIDVTEPWANFDVERNLTEFDLKYYSTDINRMYLQYDLVYPSGTPFESKIKLHTVNVRLDDALVSEENKNTSLNFVSNAEKKWLEDINLYVYGRHTHTNAISLYSDGTLPTVASGSCNLFVGSAYFNNSNINLLTFNKNTLDTSAIFGEFYGLNLYVSGRFNQFNEEILPIIAFNNPEDQLSVGTVPLFTRNVGLIEQAETSVILITRASPFRSSVIYRESIPLYIDSPRVPNSIDSTNSLYNMNLFVSGEDPNIRYNNSSMNLFTINYPPVNNSLSQQYTITWNSNNSGKNISVDDNKYAYLDANDEIRGVELLCYGNCSNGTCKENSVILHGDVWSTSEECVDGGIFRAKNTYTNLDTSGFKTDIGYSGHFYGMRKYTGLIPQVPYLVNIIGKTGSKATIELPTEYTESEYGTDDSLINRIDVSGGLTNYTNRKLTAESPSINGLTYNRQINEQFGKSVAVNGDLACVGAPGHDMEYQELDSNGNIVNFTLEDAGAVYIYRRESRPIGYSWPNGKQKSPWNLEERLYLPSGFRKDYYDRIETNKIGGIDLPTNIIQRKWHVGQEGRQFGHSLDLAVSEKHKSFDGNNREVLVVGGPSAKWDRDFDDLNTSGVQIGLMIFTDEFTPIIPEANKKPPYYSYQDILNTIYNKDLVFRYFSDPAIRFDVKLIICEPINNSLNVTIKEFPEPKPSFIIKKQIDRIKGKQTAEQNEQIFNQIKDAFHEAFPHDETKLHNNIPPILGFYADDSASMRGALGKAKDLFKDYYLNYSFASGLRDFYGTQSSGAFVEYKPIFGAAENWVVMSQVILDEVLDTGRLVNQDQVKYLTSGVGQEFFNENLSQFNYPPESGGRVYVFEKESGSWNLIQEIKSPNITYGTPDRFGHSVSISDNSEVIAVGSPYISEACKVYEYKPQEKDKLYLGLYPWLLHKNSLTGGLSSRYRNLIDEYELWVSSYGVDYSNKILYSKLDSTEKFEARKYLNIEEYQNIYTYKYSDIGFNCPTWDFIPEHFAPTSRLGYSTAVNEDGSIVAFGAPTDSFNEWEDGNVWYKNTGYYDPSGYENLNTNSISPSWINSTNAGAVRLFESRQYYPHNSVVEFGKFGNLQESMAFPEDSGHFNYLASAFRDMNFRKTDFTEVNIPQEAGLAFIITPEVDALSDEVISNITNWLALGDRNLVLVGNDPIWEKDGIYEISNTIINTILDRLQSRLRIFPARNSYEALSSGAKALPSYIPKYSMQSYIEPITANACGVGDIRVFIKENTNFSQAMTCNSKNDALSFELVDNGQAAFEVINEKCELPLKHLGDLRAEWTDRCKNCKDEWVYFPVNWAYLNKRFTPPCCAVPSVPQLDGSETEPMPVMVAGDYLDKITVIPASPAVSGFRPVYRVEQGAIRKVYNESAVSSGIAFVWSSEQSNYSYLSINDGQINSQGLFYQPELFEDRQSLLMANAIAQSEVLESKEQISDRGYYCVEETRQNKSSKIVFIAGVDTESEASLYSGFGDQNLNFYANLVGKNINGDSYIAQLGGWTKRTKFTDGFADSFLFNLFENVGNSVDENVITLLDQYDVCWIANPAGLPSQQDINALKSWLNLPNKKLIVTYDKTLTQVLIAKQLSDMLDSNIKPLYASVLDTYPIVYPRYLRFNPIHPVSTGWNKNTSIDIFNIASTNAYVPLALNNNVVPICYNDDPVDDKKLVTNGYWKTKSGVAKVSFPAMPGSGYKIFITTISETPSENQSLVIGTQNVNRSITAASESDNGNLLAYNFDTDYYVSNLGDVYRFDENNIQNNKPITYSFNAQVLRDSSTIDFYISSNLDRLLVNTSDYQPKTVRLLGISGVLVPIENMRLPSYEVFDRMERYRVSDPQPEVIIREKAISPILNDNTIYCPDACKDTLGHRQVADGPMVVAQEIEHFSQFATGVARSRITIISDSSLVQGKYMGDENYRMTPEQVRFLRSLYPYTNWPNTNAGRQFTNMTKIMSPERGSPQKYRALVNNSGIAHLFGNSIGSPSSISNFSDKESRYDPKFVRRPKNPWPDDASKKQIDEIKKGEILSFQAMQSAYGATSMFSGVFNSKWYRDTNVGGAMPEIMKDTGYDYLDFEVFPSGYPGDLFGYSIALYKNKLVVGSPYNAFSRDKISSWDYIINGGAQSGISLSYNGGAGSVYIFERNNKGSGLHGTITPWSFTQKLRPNSINIGSDSGIGIMGDRFGNDVDIDGDIIVVGAPGHDYGNYVINGSGSFIRRSFNPEFNIPSRSVYDLGSSGNRALYNSQIIENCGAIFTFENKIVDWPTKTQKWIQVEKVVENAPYYHENTLYDKQQSDRFGESVSIDRSRRTDSDYTILGGSKNTLSNSNISISGAGSVFMVDIMLRGQAPAIQSPNAYIDAKFFGERNSYGEPTVSLIFSNNYDSNKEYKVSGIVYSNDQGEIFVEASGQDPVLKGFIQHRPYIKSLDGVYMYGSQNSGNFPLFIDGTKDTFKNMNLFTEVDSIINVYNDLGMYTSAVAGLLSNDPSGLLLYVHTPDPTIMSSGLSLYMASGIGSYSDNLNLRIRGK